VTDGSDGTNQSDPVDPANEIIKRLTPALRPEKVGEAKRVIATVMQKLHVGPLPPPEDLAHYDAVCPGAAERIISMAEGNQSHRQQMERDHLRLEYNLQSRGQWLAISALISMLLLVGFTFYIGQPIAASVLGAGTIVAVVGMFLKRDRPEREEVVQRPQPRGKRKRRGG
jgi:uncharacterized membrane protein